MSDQPLSIDAIVAYASTAFAGIQDDRNWGERALFYNPGRKLAKGIYFLTFKERDGANDRASRIVPGEYRLNLGIPRSAFVARFGPLPARPAAGGVVDTGHDFAACDVVVPHPVYGWMSWIAVKNPSAGTFDALKPLLADAHGLAVAKFGRKAGGFADARPA